MTMKNINLDKYSPFHKTGHTSKGDQRKWEIDGIWYKADYMGYESLAEVLVSRLLKKSSLQNLQMSGNASDIWLNRWKTSLG